MSDFVAIELGIHGSILLRADDHGKVEVQVMIDRPHGSPLAAIVVYQFTPQQVSDLAGFMTRQSA